MHRAFGMSVPRSATQHNTREEKQAIREGRIPEDWKDRSAKFALKDRDARWTTPRVRSSRLTVRP
jgi:transposase, IS5 family